MIAQQVLNEWYPVAMAAQIRAGQRRVTQVLGQPITVDLQKGAIVVTGQGGALHPVQQAWPARHGRKFMLNRARRQLHCVRLLLMQHLRHRLQVVQ